MIEIRQGVTRGELIKVIMQSERAEEAEQALDLVDAFPIEGDYDPTALAMLRDGQVVAAAGLKIVAPKTAAFWLASCEEFRTPVQGLKALKKMLKDAQDAGLRVVTAITRDNARARRAAEYFGMREEDSPQGRLTTYTL